MAASCSLPLSIITFLPQKIKWIFCELPMTLQTLYPYIGARTRPVMIPHAKPQTKGRIASARNPRFSLVRGCVVQHPATHHSPHRSIPSASGGCYPPLRIQSAATKIPRFLSGIVTGRVQAATYSYNPPCITKKHLHLSVKCDKMRAIWENAAIGLPAIGLRHKRERDGGIRLRAMPGFLPGAAA